MNSKFLTRVEEFVAETVAPASVSWSRGDAPGNAHFLAASALGLTSLELPESAGGLGFDFQTKAAVGDRLAAADFGFAMSVINTHNVALRLCRSADAELCGRFLTPLLNGQFSACTALTEPGAGSDVASLTTTATVTDDGWMLQGEKSWIVNARHANVAIVYAQCRQIGDGNGIGAFVVDLTAKGVTRYAIDSVFAQTSIGTGGFTLDEVAVASNQLILPPGTAFKAILSEINEARIYVAVMCNAMLREAIRQTARYGDERRTFGRTLNQHASWQQLIDDAEHALTQSQQETERAIVGLADSNIQLLAINAKLKAVDTCQQHLPMLLHAMGAEGLRAQYCFSRHIAATQLAGFTDGANHMLRQRAAQLIRKG